jgi:hypothetical protein
VRKPSAFVAVMLAGQPFVVFGRNVVFPPDPVGMRLYQERHLMEMLALCIVVCALLLGCLFRLARSKPKTTVPENGWFYDI